MFKRLLMFLLVIGLAVPAVGAPLCHGPERPQAMHETGMMHHEGERHGKAHGASAATHDCIGCIAAFVLAAPEEAPPFIPGLRHTPGESLFLPMPDSEPAPPPPRA